MRSVQEETLARFFKDLRRGGTYNRKWWNPIEFSMYVHDLVRYEEIPNVVEIGTGNGVTASWAALGGANVWTCDMVDRPKVWDAVDIFPLPNLTIRIEYFTMLGDDFLGYQAKGRAGRIGPRLFKGNELLILDGPNGEKGFRRQWDYVRNFVRKDDIIVAPIGSPDIYQCFLKLKAAGYDIKYNTSTESYTLIWPAEALDW